MKYSDDVSDKDFGRIIRREFGSTLGNMVIHWLDRLDASNEQARQRRECRERDVALSNFEACQACPKCGACGFHLMQPGVDRDGYITRECGECSHSWRQK
jgi:hypothetical protein